MSNAMGTAGTMAAGKRAPQRVTSSAKVSGVEVADSQDKSTTDRLAKSLMAKFSAMGSKSKKRKFG